MDKQSDRIIKRTDNEILHGRVLVQNDPENIWGWGTTAGRLRAMRRAELIAAGANLAPGKYVLEIGCGTGMFTEMFAQKGSRIVAVDISADLLEKAISRALPHDKVQFLAKRFEECDVDGPFDAVIGSSVLHHLDIKIALSKIYGLLKSGGIMSFAEPNMLNPQIWMERNIPAIRRLMNNSPDETAFFRWSIKKIIEDAGFVNVQIVPFDFLHPATPKMLIRVVNKLGNIFEKIVLLREIAGSLYIKAFKP